MLSLIHQDIVQTKPPLSESSYSKERSSSHAQTQKLKEELSALQQRLAAVEEDARKKGEAAAAETKRLKGMS